MIKTRSCSSDLATNFKPTNLIFHELFNQLEQAVHFLLVSLILFFRQKKSDWLKKL